MNHPEAAPARRAYVPALDGLRALAVLAVLFYHLDGKALPGGFLGVSSFFTLSGFLITTLLLNESEATGRIDLRAFWGRRWRRLLPAMIACLGLVVALAAAGGFVSAQVDSVRQAIPWALGYLANWHQLLHAGGYLQALAAPSPLEHFWSLAIEEQFYVVFPLLVAAVMIGGRKRPGRSSLAVCLAALAAASLAATLVGALSEERVYLGTDTRMFEVLVGALLAVALRRGLAGPAAPKARQLAGYLGAAALAAQIVAWGLVDDSTGALFRGGLPVYALGSVCVIAGALSGGPLARALEWRPLVLVGAVSYGVYLYHWPIFVWLTEERTGVSGAALVALRLTTTAVVSAASFVLVENPIRHGRPVRVAWRPALAFGAAGLLLLSGLALPGAPDLDIAGMDQAGQVLPDVAPTRDRLPWKVLLVVDNRSEPLVSALRRASGPSRGWLVSGVARFECQGRTSGVCPWERDWATEMDRAGADAAVLLTDAWDYRTELARSHPGLAPTSTEAVDWAVGRLTAGIDALGQGPERPVLWAAWEVDPAGGARQALADVAWSVDRRLSVARPFVIKANVGQAPAPAEISRFISGQAEAAAGQGTAVMVVGDSVASSMASGLASWGRSNDVVVWDNARGGCGVVRDGRRRALDGTLAGEEQCRPWRATWVSAARRWGADLTVVLVGVWDASDRELPGQSKVRSPGDPAWDRFVRAEYQSVVDDFARAGIPVVIVAPPCMGYEGTRVPGGQGGGHPVFAAGRQQYLKVRLLARLSDAVGYDLFGDLCPAGKFEELRVGEDLVRPDGVHFGHEGSRWWADQHADDLIGQAQRRR